MAKSKQAKAAPAKSAAKQEGAAGATGAQRTTVNGMPAKPNGAPRAAQQGKAGAQARKQAQEKAASPTIAHTLGEMVWLMTRSPLHKHLKIADLEWLLMPAILLNQFRLFRAGEQVVGLALWAYLTPEQAEEMGKSGRLKPENWRHGTDVLQLVKDQQAGKKIEPATPALKDGEVELWIVDFMVPFATAENKLAQACMADFVRGPLKGAKVRMHKTDPKSGEKTTITLGGE